MVGISWVRMTGISWVEATGAAHHPAVYSKAPLHQRTIWSQTSVVLRQRNPDLQNSGGLRNCFHCFRFPSFSFLLEKVFSLCFNFLGQALSVTWFYYTCTTKDI